MYPYWLMRAHDAEGAAWLDRLLGAAAKPMPTVGRARALQTASVAAATSGQRVWTQQRRGP